MTPKNNLSASPDASQGGEDNEKKDRKFRIEDLAPETRKTIFKITLTVLTLLIIGVWFFSLRYSLSQIEDQPTNTWTKIKDDVGEAMMNTQDAFSKIKEGFGKIKNIAPTSTIATTDELELEKNKSTTTIQLSPEEIDKLKEEIKKIGNQ